MYRKACAEWDSFFTEKKTCHLNSSVSRNQNLDLSLKKNNLRGLGQEWGKLDFHSLLKVKVSIFYCFVLFFQREQEPRIQVCSKLFQDLVALPDLAERQKKICNMNSTGLVLGPACVHDEAASMKMHTPQPFPPWESSLAERIWAMGVLTSWHLAATYGSEHVLAAWASTCLCNVWSC